MNRQLQPQRRVRRSTGYHPPNPVRVAPVAEETLPAEILPPAGASTPQCPPGIDDLPLAMAYVPIQRWGTTYGPDKALLRGTIFPALDLPFMRGAKV